MSLLNSVLSLFPPPASGVRRVEPVEAARLVREDRAVLVDVREPAEWSGGVAAPAALLPLSDLTGGRRRWAPFLKRVGEREIILYCHSGARCRLVARILTTEGFRAASAGRLQDWAGANLPLSRPKPVR